MVGKGLGPRFRETEVEGKAGKAKCDRHVLSREGELGPTRRILRLVVWDVANPLPYSYWYFLDSRLPLGMWGIHSILTGGRKIPGFSELWWQQTYYSYRFLLNETLFGKFAGIVLSAFMYSSSKFT